MSKTVFMSRSMDEDGMLAANLRENGIELIAFSLITIKPVPFDPNIPETDWIFFSSRNAVNHFFVRKPVLHHQKFAAIGRGTAEALSDYAEIHFTGSSNDSEEVAKEFAAMIGDASVLFPQSDESMRSVQQFLKGYQCVDLICYSTNANPRPVGFPDVLVFSSPSNVYSFFITNKYMEYQRCIAFGPSTASALHENGVDSVCVLEEISDEVLLNAINDAILGSTPWS